MITRRRVVVAPLDPNSSVSVRKFRDDLARQLEERLVITEPVNELLLYSPTGSVWAVKVSDTGVLSTELRATP